MENVNMNTVVKLSVHPLLIDVAVDNLFKYLPLNETTNKRRVCKLWHQIGTKHLVKFIDEIEISFGSTFRFRLDVPDRRKTIEIFLQMDKRSSLKFTNFSFHSDDHSDPILPNAKETIRLFDLCGNRMKNVRLNLSEKATNWKFLADVLMNKAPNMELLHIIGHPEGPGRVDKRLFPILKPELKLKALLLSSEREYRDPIFSEELLTDLFECSPDMEILNVDLNADDEPGGGGYFHEIVILQTLREKGNICNLKELYLSAGNYDVFEILATSFKAAPLNKFTIQILELIFTMLPNIDIFLYDHKDTFDELNLVFPCIEVLHKLTFPKMENLKRLSITESDWCINGNEFDECHAPLDNNFLA